MISKAVKNQMIEKKLILCGIIAVIIGIATIVPAEYMMAAEAQANAKANTQTASGPWFNVSIPYAYVNLNQSSGPYGYYVNQNGTLIQIIAHFTLPTPSALDLKNGDARIEFFLFQVSSDQGPIVNITYTVAFTEVSAEELNGTSVPGGVETVINGTGAIIGGGGNAIIFADGTTYNATKLCGDSDCGGLSICEDVPGVYIQNFTNVEIYDWIDSAFNIGVPNPTPQAVIELRNTELRNAKTLYIDVSRICSVSYEGNATTATVTTTLASHQVLQHIVLTKTGDGFVYGTYTEGTVPFPMWPIEGPSTTPEPSAPTINATIP